MPQIDTRCDDYLYELATHRGIIRCDCFRLLHRISAAGLTTDTHPTEATGITMKAFREVAEPKELVSQLADDEVYSLAARIEKDMVRLGNV